MTTNASASYTGKVAFITGGANGIGRATALAFARVGASVVVADVSEHGNRETVRLIEAEGGRALAVRCDVTRAEDVKAALAKTVAAFGRLDFAFNNAGVEQKKLTPLADLDEEEWDRILNIDLRSVFLCMKYQIPLILKQGGGAIVNTSSGAGVIGIKGNPAYTAAKHGVIGLTRAAALDYAAQNIRINAVCPGYIDTPMMGRFTGGTPEGRAKVIAEEPVGRMGKPRGDRRSRHLAVLGYGRLRRRARPGHRRRPDGAVARQKQSSERISTMKRHILLALASAMVFSQAGCSAENKTPDADATKSTSQTQTAMKIQLKLEDKVLTATLNDSKAARDFAA